MQRVAAFLISLIIISISGVVSTLGQETVVFDLRKEVIDHQSGKKTEGEGEQLEIYDPGLSPFKLPVDDVVSPGQLITWEIWVRIASLSSKGLALACIDLVQDSGNPLMFHVPPAAGVPNGMTNFSRPAGITNPDWLFTGSGYTGTQRYGNLLQIGGAQNTFGSPLSSGIGENDTVVPWLGAGQEVLLACGAFTAPNVSGRYRFRIENGVANVLDEINTPPDFCPVSRANVIYSSRHFSFTVATQERTSREPDSSPLESTEASSVAGEQATAGTGYGHRSADALTTGMTTDGFSALHNGSPLVTGFSQGSPSQGLTTGGTEITFSGENFISGMSVVFKTPEFEEKVPPGDVFANKEGTELTVTVPPVAPGCDCGEGKSIPTNIVFDNGLGQSDLFSQNLRFDFEVARTRINFPSDVQTAIDLAQPGNCLVLEANKDHSGPILFDIGRSKITLTSENPFNPGRTRIHGGDLAGKPQLAATVTLEGCGDGVCLSGLTMTGGNSGIEILKGAAPRIKNCIFEKNVADHLHGGGMTISSGARPIVYGNCLITRNSTSGSGGGIRIEGASAVLIDSHVFDNSAAVSGGGLYLLNTPANLIISNNEICSNSLGLKPAGGGGIYWAGRSEDKSTTGVLMHNKIRGNAADKGAGIYVGRQAAPIIVSNVICENHGISSNSEGGAIFVAPLNNKIFPIFKNQIHGNEAQVGGAIALMEGCRTLVERNLIYGNRAVQYDPENGFPYYAAGIYLQKASPFLLHNTIYGNLGAGISDQGGGIHGHALSADSPRVLNNIIVNNEGWEVYSDSKLAANRLDWNLAYDAKDTKQLFAPPTNPGRNNTAEEDPLFVRAESLQSNPWRSFSTLIGSPCWRSGSDGCDLGAVFTTSGTHCEPVCCLPFVVCGRDQAKANTEAGLDLPDCWLSGTCTGMLPEECDCADIDFDGEVDLDDLKHLPDMYQK